MCGRYATGPVTWADYRDWLHLTAPAADETDPTERYNVAPTTKAPIVAAGEQGRVGRMARWGLIPHWFAKPIAEMKFSTFNARSEDAAAKPMFRDAIKHGRCLVPAIGYYEWTGPKGAKTPFFISVERNAPAFCFAGVRSFATLPDFEGETFSILTRPPEDPIAHIHNRMPIILDESAFDAWLEGAASDQVGRVDPSRLRFHPVGRAVGNVRNDRPELIKAVGS